MMQHHESATVADTGTAGRSLAVLSQGPPPHASRARPTGRHRPTPNHAHRAQPGPGQRRYTPAAAHGTARAGAARAARGDEDLRRASYRLVADGGVTCSLDERRARRRMDDAAHGHPAFSLRLI